MTSKLVRVFVVALLGAFAAAPGHAAFHIAVIDEVLTSVGGDATQQFVEIRQLFMLQNQVSGSVLAAFDATGAYLGDVLVVPSNLDVSNSHAGARWIMATQKFQDAHGFMADFTIPSGRLPVDAGMICWGAPQAAGTFTPVPPGSWDHTDPTKFVDCVAYGSFTGSNSPSGAPVASSPADHSIARVSQTQAKMDQQFDCNASITPTNNHGATLTIGGAACPTIPPSLAGGGSLKTDCYGEWAIVGATTTKPVFKCKHGAATCDDGAAGAAACSLSVRLCFDDVTAPQYHGKCTASPVSAFALTGKQKDATDQANGRAIIQAVKILGGTASANEVTFAAAITTRRCTQPIRLTVPLVSKGGKTKRGTRTFKTVITAAKVDRDTLKITCTP